MSTLERVDHIFPHTCKAEEKDTAAFRHKVVSHENIHAVIKHGKLASKNLSKWAVEMQKSSGTMHPDLRDRIDALVREAEYVERLFKFIRMRDWMKEIYAVMVTTLERREDSQ